MTPPPNPQSAPSGLEAAVQHWVQVVLSQLTEKGPPFLPGAPGVHPVLVVSPEQEEKLLEIGKTLGKPGYFRNPSNLSQFLWDSLEVILPKNPREPLDISQLAAQLAQRLANPLQRFQFKAPLALRSEFSFSGPLGGQNELAIESVERDGRHSMSVSGQVMSTTEPSAITAVEQILETVLGLSLALDLCSMLSPLPGTNPNLSLEISPHMDAIPTSLAPVVSAGVSGAYFRVPQSISDLERRHIEAHEYERGFERYFRHLTRILVSSEDRATELRHAGAFLLRASVMPDLGLALTYSFMCLEALLLERSTTDNVLSRLVEAIAYRIGASAAHRAKLRREVKELYNVRSLYVHTGDPGPLAWTRPRERCLDIVSDVLRREIEDAEL